MNNIGININSSKDNGTEVLNSIKEIIYNYNNSCDIKVFYDSKNMDEATVKDLDMVIVLGGDGTILQSGRKLCKFAVPILGINIGNLGFLSTSESSQLKTTLEQVLSNNYYVEDRMMIQCSYSKNNENFTFHALNDIVISKSTLSRVVKYEILINNCFYEKYTADGIVFSTPTGSTAYSLSVGGPIIYPTTKLILITPLCAHRLNTRSFVSDNESNIEVLINKKKGDVYLTVDGQNFIDISDINSINLSKSPYICKLIRLYNYDYFKVLRNKIINKA